MSVGVLVTTLFFFVPPGCCWSPREQQPFRMVSFHGHVLVKSRRRMAGAAHLLSEKPPDPSTLLDDNELSTQVQTLLDWWNDKKSVFCITGAGLSTESGIPDYRGHKGSYHSGHKPVIHHQYMESPYQRQRYWGRAMVGWSEFDLAQPNKGHRALAKLEQMGRLGVTFADSQSFYEDHEADQVLFGSGQRQLAIVTQNVDSLHQRAGSKRVIQLHGNGNKVKCMNCGRKRDRNDFHKELEQLNEQWLRDALMRYQTSSDVRPDGDALLKEVDYNEVRVPTCSHCGVGFFKTDVVFFGDNVPKSRVKMCEEAVKSADGILVVGSSLSVHSAYRHVRAATSLDIPVAILNVGETRAEAEGLQNILKIEAPAGRTLELCAAELGANGKAEPSKLSGDFSRVS